jgi:hypothetical protein
VSGSVRSFVALVVTVTASVALGACSGSVSVGSEPSPTGPVTYTDDEYGYSITRDAMFSEGTVKDVSASAGNAVAEAIFADENGTLASGSYLDAILVTVYELARSVTPAEVPDLKAEMQEMIDDLLASLSDAKVVQPLTETEVGGVPGFAVTYTYEDLGKELTAASFFLFKDKYEYQITTQSVTERWDELKGRFQDAVQSFALK